MYSGTIITRGSGRLMGTHQKIDRISRRKLQRYLAGEAWFPTSKEILRFEGLNGPDGIKRKSPAHDEPRHFIDPNDPNDNHLIELIKHNENNLIQAIASKNREKAAFEASWLSHAITDGLTPAHHYPYEERLSEIRGSGHGTQNTIFKKIIMPGDTVKDKFINNWEYWKPGGLMTSHGLYEWGVAIVSAPIRFKRVKLTAKQRQDIVKSNGITDQYRQVVKKIDNLKMYENFLNKGWNTKLANQTNRILMPTIIWAVLASWYYCAYKGGEAITDNKDGKN